MTMARRRFDVIALMLLCGLFLGRDAVGAAAAVVASAPQRSSNPGESGDDGSVASGTDDLSQATTTPMTTTTTTEKIIDLQKPIDDLTTEIMRRAFPIVQEFAYDENLNHRCTGSLMKIGLALRRLEIWAMKFLDSMGRPPAGAMEGTLGGLGAYDECLSIVVPNSEGKQDFKGQYCSLFMKAPRQPFMLRIAEKVIDHPLLKNRIKNVSELVALQENSLVLGLRLGVCIPSTCSGEELKYIVTKLTKKYGVITNVKGCRVDGPIQLSKTQIAMLWLFGSLGIMVGLATSIDLTFWCRGDTPRTVFLKSKLPIRILLAFSALANTKKLMRVKIDKNSESASLQCIHGVRLFSACWVLLGHSYVLLEPHTAARALSALEWLQNFAFTVVANGFPSVDTFFLLSGFLVGHGLLLRLKKKTTNVGTLLPVSIYRRYVRLTIPAMFIVGFGYLYPLLAKGPVADEWLPYLNDRCDKGWWNVLSHTNNYNDLLDICMPHLWYVACDFQIFVGTILFIFILARKPKFGLTCIFLSCIALCVAMGIQTYANDYPPYNLAIGDSVNKTLDMAQYLYFRPFCHAIPFLVGIITAYLVITCGVMKMSKLTLTACWCAASCSALAVVFGVYQWNQARYENMIGVSLYAGAQRLAWSLSVAWVLFVCMTGNGGLANRFLSWKVFVPLSRLTFALYLVHVLVIGVRALTTRQTIFFSQWLFVRDFLGHLVLSYFFAYIFFLICECPCTNLDKILFELIEGRDRKNTSDQEKTPHKMGTLNRQISQETEVCKDPALNGNLKCTKFIGPAAFDAKPEHACHL